MAPLNLPITIITPSIQAIQSRTNFPQYQYQRNSTITMVQLALLFTVGLSALTGLVTASSCSQGLKYCGYNLLHKGKFILADGALTALVNPS